MQASVFLNASILHVAYNEAVICQTTKGPSRIQPAAAVDARAPRLAAPRLVRFGVDVVARLDP